MPAPAAPLLSETSVLVFRVGFHLLAGAAVVAAMLGGRDPAEVGWLLGPLLVAAGSSWFARRVGLLALLLFDAAVLTVLLSQFGGAANPFTLMYFVQVTLAAVILRPFGAGAVVVGTSLGYGCLFLSGGGHAHGHGDYSSHLQGMWIAFTVTSALVGGFVSRLSQALLREREQRARSARLLGLTTLAAGAAHEIGNPLGTIKLVAHDLEKELRSEGHEEWSDDVRVVLDEVERARRVLEQLASSAGELNGEGLTELRPSDLMVAVRERLGGAGERMRLAGELPDAPLELPVHATAQAVAQLVRNGLEASEDGTSVGVGLRTDATWLEVLVEDRGTGMSPEILDRAGEPFFSTKAVGSGMGLGLFLVRSLAEQLGGGLTLSSTPGRGTTVRFRVPRRGRGIGPREEAA